MHYTILLDKNENTKEVEAQEQARFVKAMLEALEIPIEFNPDEPLTIESKLTLRKSFTNYRVNIIDDSDGGVRVYLGEDLIGEWKKPFYVLKKDVAQPDPSKKLYLEMNIHFWSLFEDDHKES